MNYTALSRCDVLYDGSSMSGQIALSSDGKQDGHILLPTSLTTKSKVTDMRLIASRCSPYVCERTTVMDSAVRTSVSFDHIC